MNPLGKKHHFTCLIPVIAVLLGPADRIHADGEVNCSIDARTATTDSDGNLSADPVKVCRSDNFVGWIRPGTWIYFRQFDFGTGPVFIELEAGAKKEGGVVFLRQDDPDGYEIGQIAIPSTGDWRVFDKFTAPLTPNSQSTGKKDLYLCFDGPNGAFNIRSFTLFDNRVPLPQAKTDEEPETNAVAGDFGETDPADVSAPPPENPVVSAEPEEGALSKLANLSTPKKIFIALPFVSLFFFFLFFLCKTVLASKREDEESKKGKTYDF